MGIMITASSVNVYAADAAEAAAEVDQEQDGEKISEDTEQQEILGEVTEVSENSITIAVGTRKERSQDNGQGKPGGEEEASGKSGGDDEAAGKPGGDDEAAGKPDGDEPPEMPSGEGQGGGAPSLLELTGEEMTVAVTDATKIVKSSMGKPGGASADGDGQDAPEKENNVSDSWKTELSLSDIKEGDVVSILLDADGNAGTVSVQSMEMGDGMGGGPGMGGPGGQSSGVDSYDAVNEYTSDEVVEDAALESTGTDENAALISDGAEVNFNNVTVSRVSEDSTGGDTSSFYGVGAAVLAADGQAYVSNSSVSTDASGAAGLFAYGDGTVYAADTTILTQQNTSGGIHAAGGGTLYAWNLNVETDGESAAAVRSDRGGGTMVVDGGTYVSNGVGSPAVYCTADIAVNNAVLTANGSEGICIEGLNSLHLYDCDLTGNMKDLDQNDTTWTVILYQSMSGDSEIGNSTFQMNGGSITSQNGGLFYTTNTECTIALNDVDINYNDDSEFFLQCTGNNNERGWGQSGQNGSDCHFTAVNQEMNGDIIWDSASDLDFYMTEGSSLTGAFIDDESYAGSGEDGYCNVYIGKDSSWTVTGDSFISTLSNEGSVLDADGCTVSVVGNDGTVYVQGDSEYIITVNSYEESADLSESTAIVPWSDYQVERPVDL
ncbi:MAG: hypothetical protein Q4D16_22525 [Eubacteriales bacterium]|nr:hypothetical protein [Eubacteriales bacterium]